MRGCGGAPASPTKTKTGDEKQGNSNHPGGVGISFDTKIPFWVSDIFWLTHTSHMHRHTDTDGHLRQGSVNYMDWPFRDTTPTSFSCGSTSHQITARQKASKLSQVPSHKILKLSTTVTNKPGWSNLVEPSCKNIADDQLNEIFGWGFVILTLMQEGLDLQVVSYLRLSL